MSPFYTSDGQLCALVRGDKLWCLFAVHESNYHFQRKLASFPNSRDNPSKNLKHPVISTMKHLKHKASPIKMCPLLVSFCFLSAEVSNLKWFPDQVTETICMMDHSKDKIIIWRIETRSLIPPIGILLLTMWILASHFFLAKSVTGNWNIFRIIYHVFF